LRTIAGGIPEITLSIPVGSDVVNALLMIGMNLAKGMNLEKTVSGLEMSLALAKAGTTLGVRLPILLTDQPTLAPSDSFAIPLANRPPLPWRKTGGIQG
jgi:hypothetical protein